MKKVLIISPYFPPSNAADAQRIRMSLPYFKEFGWEPTVVRVSERYSEMVKDPLLLKSVPADIRIIEVYAWSKTWTGKLGIGSLAYRCLFGYRMVVDKLLRNEHFDLVYFSTTAFPVMILGQHWKKKFRVPYVIDMQDPWHSDYYQHKPASERPKKYWFSYRLNKYLEPIAMKHVGGLISVSDNYIITLKQRYPALSDVPATTITFAASDNDLRVAGEHKNEFKTSWSPSDGNLHLVYVGRGGFDMHDALKLLFFAFGELLQESPGSFSKIRFHFIGTSYAPAGSGQMTIKPLADQMGLAYYVSEQTDRISFYNSLFHLNQANALVVPGSDDPAYTASKIFPYIQVHKPILAIFNAESSAARIINEVSAGDVADVRYPDEALKVIRSFLINLVTVNNLSPATDWGLFRKYSAQEMTRKQTELFDTVLSKSEANV